MAKVLGECGRYVSDEAVAKTRYFLLAVFIGIGLDALLLGLFLSQELWGRKTALWLSGLPVVVTAVILWFLFMVADWKLKKFEQKRVDFLKGPVGEMVVAHHLAGLPDGYVVINDLATPYGTLDHVVVGPTGVYIIETRDWRGLITADGQGDILCNGNLPPKPLVRTLLDRILNVRDQVAGLYAGRQPGTEMPLFKGMIVFPAAWVEARLGTTGSAFCLNENQVYDFIVGNKWNDELDPSQIKRLVRAFLALAKSDKKSLSTASITSRPELPQTVSVS